MQSIRIRGTIMDVTEEAIAIATKTLYLNKDLSYIKNATIVEYDLKSAGFSVIKEKELLPADIIAKLEEMPKKERNIAIGKYQKEYPNLAGEIVHTLEEVRVAFVVHNGIEPQDILSIKKDAIFLINKVPNYLKFGKHFEFRPKDSFTSYMYLNDLEIYYSSRTKEFVVKNFKSEREWATEYGETIEKFDPNKEALFLDIKRLMALSEKNGKDALFNILKNYRSAYLNRELPKESYRDVATGMYYYKGKRYKFINKDMIGDIDIRSNYVNYICPLIGIML